MTCFGQEFNPETYAIAKADMLIKGGNSSGMKYGDTLLKDRYTEKKDIPCDAFEGYEFDYVISIINSLYSVSTLSSLQMDMRMVG